MCAKKNKEIISRKENVVNDKRTGNPARKRFILIFKHVVLNEFKYIIIIIITAWKVESGPR